MASCKYCGINGLTWERTLNNKWILLDNGGQKHYCVKPKIPNMRKISDLKDAKIEKALEKYEKELNKSNRPTKIYYLKRWK